MNCHDKFSVRGIDRNYLTLIAITPYDQMTQSIENGIANSLELISNSNEPKYLIENATTLVPWRDFHAEVRGWMDTRNLAEKCCVLLDVKNIELADILNRMIDALNQKILKPETIHNNSKKGSRKGPQITYEKIRKQIFNEIGHGDVNIKRRLQNLIVSQEGLVEDQSWLALYCSSDEIDSNWVVFSRLSSPTNLGTGLGDVQFIILAIAPLYQKELKTAYENARTFATLFSCSELRLRLSLVNSKQQFCEAIEQATVSKTEHDKVHNPSKEKDNQNSLTNAKSKWRPGQAIIADLRRRWPHYKSDYLDGLRDARAVQKTISSAVFLYFAIMLTAIALGMLNDSNTHGKIKVKETILGQWIGGLFFGVFGGQLFLVMLTSPPMSIYIQVMDELSKSTGFDFYHMYAAIGIWCSVFLALMGVFELAFLMKFAKRSLVELFGCFISTSLTLKAVGAMVGMFRRYDPHCLSRFYPNGSIVEPPPLPHKTDPLNCEMAVGLLFLVLMLGTVWISLSLYSFRSTPYLTKRKREILSDYALPIGIVLMAVVANVGFPNIPKQVFTPADHPPPPHHPPHHNILSALGNPILESDNISAVHNHPTPTPPLSLHLEHPHPPPPQPPRPEVGLIPFWEMPWTGQLMCMVLGFPLAILFFMDQLIVTNTVDNLQNNLKKGEAPNWDLIVVSILNVFLSLYGLLWMHGALPQAYLHLRSLADVEDRLVDGRIQEVIVKNRESRIAILLAHAMMIPTYYFLLPYLHLFPTAIFHGLFLYLAYTSAMGNEFCQRISLFFTEQRCYPPSHYNRRVPQRIVHIFTAIELAQLLVLLLVGFFPWPVVELTFPIVIFLFIPFRSLVLPRFIDSMYLEVLDGTY